jgi:DNA primase small subunit
MVDYLTGNGIFFGNLGYNLSAKRHSAPTGKGLWPKRINAGIKRYFEGDPKRVSAITGAPLKKVKELFSVKGELLKALDRGTIFSLHGRKSKEFWETLLYEIVQDEKLGIDRQTSVDMHKIIRVPETLHGETGFAAKTIPLEGLKNFSPFSDAVVFGGGEVKLSVGKTPEFEVMGKKFGPFEEGEESLPLCCAVYLVGKGKATPL